MAAAPAENEPGCGWGRLPLTAAAYINRCRRREARWTSFTDLDPELLDAILDELPA